MTGRHLIIDFEASSLGSRSYPVEIGWCTPEGAGESHLIRPEPGWVDWDPKAEEIHGYTRSYLLENGRPASEVAHLYSTAARDAVVYCDGGGFDRGWSAVLLSTAGLTLPRLRPIEHLYLLAFRPLHDRVPTVVLRGLATSFLQAATEQAEAELPKTHRALADAQQLARVYQLLVDRVAEELR